MTTPIKARRLNASLSLEAFRDIEILGRRWRLKQFKLVIERALRETRAREQRHAKKEEDGQAGDGIDE